MEAGKDLSGSRWKANRGFLLASALIILSATCLRIYHVNQRSLWFDEAIAANISRGTLAETLTLARAENSAPIAHSLALYVVEKVDAGTLAVRGLSVVASVLAVWLMLCFASIPSIDKKAAILSALMLSVSAAQIRYAQEVREYSLSVLYAGLLLYLFMSFTESREKPKLPIALYLALFAAPFVQYGLVLFGLGILATLFILRFLNSKCSVKISQVMVASLSLAVGSLLSFMLTLRYQWGGKPTYLAGSYFTPGSSFRAFIWSLRTFVWSHSRNVFEFLLPGPGVALISAIAIVFYLAMSFRERIVSPLVVLAFASLGTVLACAIFGFYPYGPIRQCLFLAPVLCLLGSVSLVQIANRIRGVGSRALFAGIACIIVVSGIFQIRLMKPYAEVEDIQRVLVELRKRLEPGDGVYIYSGAVPAVDFYVKERDQRFTYGDFHRKAPEKYVPELLAGLRQDTSTTWILFSHIYKDEDQRILRDLSGQWDVEPTLFATGTALYGARCRSAVLGTSKEHYVESGKPARDSFWDWNIRNTH